MNLSSTLINRRVVNNELLFKLCEEIDPRVLCLDRLDAKEEGA